MSVEQESTQLEGIAIIGMACRFPGATTLEEFWQNLRGGVESIKFFSDEELDRAVIDPAELRDPKYVKARGVLEGIELFDARFFDFSPREAEITDPQQRIFMEAAWEALERSGYDPSRYEGPIGVYAGAGANGYLLNNLSSAGHLTGTVSAFQAVIHNKNDHLATRVAYKLNLKGPAVTVQTACSTSLVAVIHACQSLLSHQCDMALAGGVTITVPQKTGFLYNERGIGSPDGHCRPFDAKAQGTVGGSGAGVVVLKRLADAIADGDRIHAVIRGGALNNDGSDKVGYTAPSVDGQAEVISLAQAVAGVSADSISYLEAHGTGTPMGDPIEIRALTQAFRRDTDKKGFCAVGAVKGNLGHLDTAAGVAGLIKTVLSLEHKQLPPSLHFEKPNPEIDFASSPFYVNARLSDWNAPAPRRAGVSSFGLGGTNAHVVLEEAPERQATTQSRDLQLLVLSARSDAALEVMTSQLAEHLQKNPTLDLADVAYTLHSGRKVFDHRRYLVCRDTRDAASALATLSPDRVITRVQEPVNRPIVFMFPGQGSQHPGMASALYKAEAVFRQELDTCLGALKKRHDLDLRPLLLDASPDDAQAAKKLEQTALTQPALFAVEYATAKLLMSWGLQPESLIGHSVGEYVAACLAGVFSLDDALDLIALRGRLMQSLPTGAMLSVQLAERDLLPLLGQGLELAAANSTASCVVSGAEADIAALEKQLAAKDVLCRRLRTSHAFHSAMMEPILAPFRDAVAKVRRSAPTVKIISNLTGTWLTPAQAADPDYWAQHLRRAVRFADGVEELLKEPEAVLLEVGPGKALQSLARWHPRKQPGQSMQTTMPAPGDATPGQEFLLRTLGNLWLLGVTTPDYFAAETRRREPLPTYPFERQRYWVDMRAPSQGKRAQRGSLEKRSDLASWFYLPVWKESAPLLSAAADARKGLPWLVFSDRAGLGTRLAEKLRALGGDVVEVLQAKAFRRTSANTYELNPTRREDYDALLAELAADKRLPERIAHLFPITTEPGTASDDIVGRSFYSLLFLAQSLGGQKFDKPPRVFSLTNGMQEVIGGDLTSPEQATVLGPTRVIPREYPNVQMRSVDVVLPPAGSAQRERLVSLLAGEFFAESNDVAVAYRNGRRWVQGFEDVRLDDSPTNAVSLRQGGVYLITGGLGGMGLAFAEALASEAKAKLVLLNRTELPPRAEWARWQEQHSPDDATSRKIAAVQKLEARGAEVLVQAADVTNLEHMRAVVAEAQRRFGALHGVIHAAGVAGGGLIQLKTKDVAAKVLAPKVLGTQVLGAVLEGVKLDFLVACSSLTCVVGRFGQVDYTSANAFMDAFVRAYQARTGTHAVTINWGAWDEVGMAARPAQQADQGRPIGHPFLQRCLVDTPKRMVFATVFGTPESQWVTDEHRILNNPTVPGVTYFEMVRAAIAERAQGRIIEIHDAFFLAPLRVPGKETREVRLIVEEDGDGYRWVVRTLPSEGSAKGVDHSAGRVRILGPRTPKFMDLEELRRRCDLPQPGSLEAEYELELGPRWKSVQSIYPGKGELLMVLEMQSEFAPDFEKLRFHPSLIDRTSGIAKSFLAEHGYYLPLGYKVLRIHGELPARVYSYAKLREESDDKETLSFDAVMMDAQGRVLAEVERLTQKRVNDPAAELRALAAAAKEAALARAVPTDERQEIHSAEGVAALQRILGTQVTPQVVVSVRDLQATIDHTDDVVRERILEAVGETRSSGELKPRPTLKVAYMAPRNEIETRISSAWQQVLGIDKVGIHDNFFELGGDSVQAIQIIAKGTQMGLQLSPQQFFQYSTIAELSEMISGVLSKQAEQGPVVGTVPLAPQQRRLLEQGPSRNARTVLLDVREGVEAVALSKALTDILTHHDALRLRFTQGIAGWQQAGTPPSGAAPFTESDLRALPASELPPALYAAEEKLRAALDAGTGPLFAATLLHLGAGQGSKLLLAAHELAADTASWRILVEDLGTATRKQSGANEGLRLKTTSFKQWSERLSEEASAESLRKEEATWLSGPWASVTKLPSERVSGSIRTHVVTMNPEETRVLGERVAGTYRADLAEALLAALARSLSKWTGGQTQLIDFTQDARAALEGLDLSRTVGCFDATAPLLLGVPASGDAAETLKGVKERVRQLPRKGLGHGLLREGKHADLAEKLRAQPKAEVSFRHLGTELPAEAAPFTATGRAVSERRASSHLLEVESFVAGGQLQVRLSHDSGAISEATLGKVTEGLLAALRELSTEGQGSKATLSSVDFPLAGLDDSQLGALAALIDEADES
ncbi:polyketide synthase type I [Myxococcus stipitatus DSM 14675]|uniref:Phenolphthiocerol/phthiocerol polyketide synthase subunit E n=1 Tax=Myxococcus stipitatus (strain DSM 14675 / JCM 12634 / Mx s8) TaxID=1278073 RepID=L7U6B1_MYXSD|nr:type I polyketide synthase [Myxococcus stipitatus]AGC43390.1 polyketide synthase type I [Myxococcus stipitatus DSM 14675]